MTLQNKFNKLQAILIILLLKVYHLIGLNCTHHINKNKFPDPGIVIIKQIISKVISIYKCRIISLVSLISKVKKVLINILITIFRTTSN